MERHQRGKATAIGIMLLAITCQGRTDPKKMESFVLSNQCCDGDEVQLLVTVAQAASPHVPHAYAA